jgi:hypothetical protein
MEERPSIKPGREIVAAFRALTQKPFLTLVLVDILLALGNLSITQLTRVEASAQILFLTFSSTLFFGVAAVYLQIAVTLAAASTQGETHGADPWLKAALRQRCFWRLVGASLLAAFFVMAGTLMLVIGAIVVGSAVALTQPAVVLERKRPVAAINRSGELTKPVRRAVGVIFAVLWFAPAALSFALTWGAELPNMAQIPFSVCSAIFYMAATIAFARVFVQLGGAPAPPVQTLLYKARAG